MFDDEKYSIAREYWLNQFRAMSPRNDSEEERSAFANALVEFYEDEF